jgi:SAM-dependent methyltransferase
MSSDLLICPGCRSMSEGRIDLRTLERAGDEMACECGRRYPIIDGVVVVASEPFVEPEQSLEATRAEVEGGPDDAPLLHLADHLSIYMDAHWPPRGALADRIRALPAVGSVVELGCSVGGMLAVHPAERLVGIELGLGPARRARRLLAGERVEYLRRITGRHYEIAEAQGIPRPATIVCGDALDPPLVPGVFDRVVALNLLDSVASPRQLLSVIDALARPGGEIVLACPYQWVTQERIGGADPAADLVAILRDGAGLRAAYTIVDEAELDWTLCRDSRSQVVYRTHYVRARKGS